MGHQAELLAHQLQKEVERLSSEVSTANARERKAFMAGIEAVQHGADFHDEEEAWQKYRCQDDSDWAVVSEGHESAEDREARYAAMERRHEEKLLNE